MQKKSNKLRLSLGLIIVFILYVISVSWRDGKIASLILGMFKKDSKSEVIQLAQQLPPATGKYNDGSYTGSAEDVYYGTVQIKAVVENGVMSDVVFLQYPNERDNSVTINERAMPILKTEAIQSQSANVDTVSGATQTTKGFIKSLTNALAQAEK